MGEDNMRISIITAAFLLASASVVSASSLHSIAPVTSDHSIKRVQAQPKQGPEQMNTQDQKAKQGESKQGESKKGVMQKKDAMPKDAKKEAKKDETVVEKVKRTWRGWTTPSHSFCVRCPIPIPLMSKTCVAKGKTVDDARSVCIQQNPLCYVSAGKC
jgi:chromosome segregation and condensation protein ScpB